MNSNLGMYLETIINRSCEFYKNKGICLIEKRQIPFKFIKTLDNGVFYGKLQAKSFLDYFGVANGKHIEFEAKQTQFEYFNTDLIKKHQ
jgi:recombination protein U